MKRELIIAALAFVVVHSVDGREVLINTDQITTLRPEVRKAGEPGKLITHHAQCLIWFTNGRFLSVLESCPAVGDLIRAR